MANTYVLLWNLRSSVPLTLAPGITLRPLVNRIDTFDLAAAGAAGFREWAVLEPMATQCFCEIESAGDAVTTPGYDVANRGWLTAVMAVLRGSGAMLPVALSPYSWDLVGGHTKQRRNNLPKLDAVTLLEDYRVRFVLSNHAKRNDVTEADAAWIRQKFDQFNALSASSQTFRFGLEASFDWRYAHDQRAAIARLWSGIEALINVSTEITYRLSLTAASLLEPRGPQRLSRFKTIKTLYNLRSKAVHGSDLSDADLLKGLDGAFLLLRDLVVATAANGHVFTDGEIDAAIMDA